LGGDKSRERSGGKYSFGANKEKKQESLGKKPCPSEPEEEGAVSSEGEFGKKMTKKKHKKKKKKKKKNRNTTPRKERQKKKTNKRTKRQNTTKKKKNKKNHKGRETIFSGKNVVQRSHDLINKKNEAQKIPRHTKVVVVTIESLPFYKEGKPIGTVPRN